MSINDYVRHMTQKYRLATAIAVLKAKPSNQTVEKFIIELKSKISDENMDTDFLDISLGSDDFNLNEYDIVINDDNHFNNNADKELLNDSVTILKDVDMAFESNDNAGHESSSLENVMNLLKEVDETIVTATNIPINENKTQRTFCESPQTYEANPNYFDVEMREINYRNTGIDKIQNFKPDDHRSTTESNMLCKNDNSHKTYIDGCNFDSETYSDNLNSKFKNNTLERTIVQAGLKNISKEANEISRIKTNIDDINNKVVNTLNSVSETSILESQNTMQNYNILIESQHAVQNKDMANKVCQNLDKVNKNTINDSQSTILYSLNGYTQDFTHVSQSQYDEIKINDNFIHGNMKYIEKDMNETEICFPSNSLNFDAITNDHTNITQTSQIINIDSTEIQYVIDNNGRTYSVLEGHSNLHESNDTNAIVNAIKNVHCSNNATPNQNGASQELFASHDSKIQSNAMSLEIPDESANTCGLNEKAVEEKLNSKTTQEVHEIFDDELIASQKEIIPFKVIEELNKIKTFLNRTMDRRASTDSYSTDSGYRSDSQSRSSFKSALQLTGNAINQSAHCLFTHLLQCPLVGSTEDITQEIARLLGRLIDKLHDNEKYPPFLEDVLESIDSLLQDISEGENASDTIILTKEDSIQRLLLLNKSRHVMQYAIEKITGILERIHTQLTNEDDLFELANVELVENVCYTFHVLEILIKRHRKTNKIDQSSQSSTQNSQDSESTLKKSSITDMWRKKWNPDYKIDKNEGCIDKKCALNKCGEVLNKVIVDCMEGYSLVSFAALQCFNLLQS